jgi:hypothetical protein
MSEKKSAVALPPEREPTATPISVYGNNVAVACPCGKVAVARAVGGDATKGAWECWCGRRYRGWPDARITNILVWDKGAVYPGPATYIVKAECPNQLDPNPTTMP